MIDYITLKKNTIRDFAEERNDLLNKSRGDWIFFVDSDEEVTKSLKKEIEKVTSTSSVTTKKSLNGFFVKRKIVFLGKVIGEDKVLRLAKKDAGKWYRSVHETWEIKGNVGVLENYIVHNTAKDLKTYIEKLNLYSQMHAKENFKEGKKSSLFKIVFYPVLKFINEFIIQKRGFVFSLMQGLHSFLSWTILYLYY